MRKNLFLRIWAIVLSLALFFTSIPETSFASSIPESNSEETEITEDIDLSDNVESIHDDDISEGEFIAEIEDVSDSDEEEQISQNEQFFETELSSETITTAISSGYEYSLDSFDKATITGYSGSASNLYIPSKIDGYDVVAIGPWAFEHNSSLAVLVIPDSVKEIGKGAFYDCSGLTEVNLPNNLESMDDRAFDDCDGLTSIFIPKSLKSGGSGYGAFCNCDNLSEVSFEEGITSIAVCLFDNCPGITKIVIPDTVTTIGSSAFYGCTNLKEVKLSEHLTTIGSSAFSSCKIEEIIIPDSVTVIGRSAFENCKELKSVTLSKNLEYLEDEAFGDCDGLTSIFIPKTIVYGGSSYGAFCNCDNLENVSFEEGITSIAVCLFANCPGITRIVIPNTVTSIESSAFYRCENLAEVTLPESLTAIGGSAFSNCKITKIVIPDSVTTIEMTAFENCGALKSVTMSNRLETLGRGAFDNCDALTSIFIPKSLRSGGTGATYAYNEGAFRNCDSLTEVTFEDGITSIAYSLFANCPGLKKIVIPDTVTSIKNMAFYGCENLNEVKLSESLETIESYAFYSCKMATIVIPESLAEIEEYAFENCQALKEIFIPQGVSEMGQEVFSGCTSLEKANIAAKITHLEEGMFKNCSSLAEVDLPDDLKTIGRIAFYGCSSLTEISIPEKVASIGEYAFNNCSGLLSLNIPDSVTYLSAYCFDGCESLRDVKIGSSLKSIPPYCFSNCPNLETIELPYYFTSITDYAFENDIKLKSITVPRTVTEIADSAFSFAITVYGVPGSYAEIFCNQNLLATFVAKTVPVDKVTLEESEIIIDVGESVKVEYQVTPADCTDIRAWKVSDTSIATVTDGVVTGKSAGNTKLTLTVTDDNGAGKKVSCNVVVFQPVTGIYLNSQNLTLDGGQTYELNAEVYPYNATNKAVEWSSSDESIATVDQYGVVTALKKGNCIIKATALDGSGVSGSCNLEVISNLYIATNVGQLESPHPYGINLCDIWKYTDSNLTELVITFSEDTMLEEDSDDYIEIRDKDYYLVGVYREDELAGETITVIGDTVYIKLVSDGFNSGDYGFTVSGIAGADMPEPEIYTVTFDYLCEGIEKAYVQTESDHLIKCPTSPVRVGYLISGWYTDKQFKKVFDFAKDTVAEDTVLYAKWEPITYYIYLNSNYEGGATKEVECKYAESKVLPANSFSRPYYRFIGWNTAPDGSGTSYADKEEVLNLSSENNDCITLYAQWEIVRYKVTYKYNDGVTEDAVTYVDGGTPTIAPNSPKRNGYAFEGWFVDNNSFSEAYDFSKPVERDVTVYACWARVWTVVIKLNGGSFYNPTEIVADGSHEFRKLGDVVFTVKAPQTPMSIGEVINSEYGMTIDWSDTATTTPYKTGYTFAGWFGEDGNPIDFAATISADVTINAKWAALYTVSKPIAKVSDEQKTDNYLYEYATIGLSSDTQDAKIYYSTLSAEALLGGTSRTLYTDSIKVADIQVANRFDVNAEAGTYKVTVYAYAAKEGNSDSAVMSETFTILSEDANAGDLSEADKAEYVSAGKPDRMWVAGLTSDGYTYTGTAITFTENDLRVYDGKHLLKQGTDYVLSYKNNVNAYTLTASDAGYVASKAPTVTITGKGNYSGTIIKTFTIKPVDLSSESVTVADKYVNKTGKAIRVATTVTFTSSLGKVVTLKSGLDYVLRESNVLNPSFINPGSYIVEVVGKYDATKGIGNYTGSTTFEFNVVDALTSFTDKTVVFSDDFNSTFKALNNSNKGTDYDGSEKKLPEDEITVNGVTLEKDTDYTVRYLRGTVETDDFILPGTITVEYTGIALYTGTIKRTYKINALPLAKATFTEDYDAEYQALYNAGKGIVFDAREHYLSTDGIITYNGDVLIEDADYVVTYSADMKKVGTHTVTYTGKGGYIGTLKKSFKISAFNVANDEKLPEADRQISVIMPSDVIYVKGGAKPEPEVILNGITLEAGKDYTISYANNTAVNTYDEAQNAWLNPKKVPALTITGKGNLSGKILRSFEIEKSTDVSALSMVVSDKVYTNKKGNFTTTVKLYDADSKLLTSGTDYEKVLKYYYTRDTELADGSIGKGGEEVGTSDIVPIGTILRVEATLKGNYEGYISEYFRIYEQNIAKAAVKVCNQIYTGREVCPDKSQIVVTMSGRVLAPSDYEIVSYTNNINKGTAKVTIKGVGDYGGEKTVNFVIAVKSLQYVIVFNGNGATAGTMKDMALTPGKDYSLPVNAYKRNNYTFTGWNTRPDGSGVDYTEYVGKKDPLFANYGVESFINIPAEETGKTLILYALWTPVEYNISYHLNGGSNNVRNTQETYTADSEEIKIYAPEREDWPEGYQFGGWYKENAYKTRISVIKSGSSGNLDLYAKWIPYTYTVSFDGNGATGSMDTEAFSYGVAKKLNKNSFKNNGYIFMGWATEADGDAIYADAEMVSDLISPRNNFAGQLTLYAVWRNEFNVTFEPNDGVMPNIGLIDKGFEVIDDRNYVYECGYVYTLPTPTRSGYTFAGWFSDGTFKTKIANIAKNKTGDITLYAKWTPITYKVTYNAAEPVGTKASGSMKQQAITYDKETALMSNVFAVPGYIFVGWSTEAGDTCAEYEDGEAVLNLTTGNTINLYAVWEETVCYAVSFESNGGSFVENVYRFPGEAFDLSVGYLIPYRPGYAFAGWYKEEALKTKVTKIAKNVYSNVRLYAKWTPLKFKIAFDKNLSYTDDANPISAGSMATQSITYGNTVRLNTNTFGIAGYRFVGWNTRADGYGISYEDCDIIDMVPGVNNETITLYAIWDSTNEYTVSFESEGGTYLGDASRRVNRVLDLSSYVPTRDGYTFGGWYKDAALKTKMTTVAANVYGDVRLYAKWIPKTYKVTFAAGEPEGLKATGKMSVQTFTYGTLKALPKNTFAIKGYNFLGWSTIQGDTEAEIANTAKISEIGYEYKEVVTLYAVWEKAEYGIVYNNVAGMDNSFNPDTYTVDDRIVLKEPEYIGDTFLGWYRDAKFSKRVYEIPQGSTGTVTLYAKWEKTRYTINYNLNCKDENAKLDTSKAGYITSYDSNRENGYVLAKAIRPGYTFVGWYKEVSCKTPVDNIVSSPNVDMTVYAKWVAEP